MPAELTSLVAELENSISRVVLGKSEVVRKCLITLLAGEHLLLEDVPGVGKTLVGKALARSLDGDFCRLQFTPDLLPSDIVGSNVFNTKTHEFVFHRGPIFANIVIADEINRTSPRTQSALLEAMSDNQVSVDGVTHDLPTPFMVIATQNPFEFEGTYPLPESQLDRFLMRISMGYPDRAAERQILESHRRGEPVTELTPVLHSDQIKQLQAAVREIEMNDSIHEYLLDIIEATRDTDDLQVGASTRAAISLYRAAQSLAMIEGREFVVPDDVKQLAVSVLAHRVIPKGYLHAGQREAVETIVSRIVDEVAVPT
ncbi:AAA family ATPase [Blastopirellula marina]|uniref:Methanol dehydrogenase regulation yeaC-like protein n=1 Tax=Blastopirellula marina DSM 3645 TaxID=314230 RepID=A3ZTW9_9BACT|nr:MoxR family ATPase [Blastopirellula marina]EAQ80026.1 methanol dehydrogenase regulation yeaC-like protein [Blastopirellula marina DSM 3645]